jgi:hypothetical protein
VDKNKEEIIQTITKEDRILRTTPLWKMWMAISEIMSLMSDERGWEGYWQYYLLVHYGKLDKKPTLFEEKKFLIHVISEAPNVDIDRKKQEETDALATYIMGAYVPRWLRRAERDLFHELAYTNLSGNFGMDIRLINRRTNARVVDLVSAVLERSKREGWCSICERAMTRKKDLIDFPLFWEAKNKLREFLRRYPELMEKEKSINQTKAWRRRRSHGFAKRGSNNRGTKAIAAQVNRALGM